MKRRKGQETWKALLRAILVSLAVCLALILLVAVWISSSFPSKAERRRNREQILSLRDVVKWGMTFDEVDRQLAANHLGAGWHQVTDSEQKLLCLVSPLEFGARNWVLRCEFKDGGLSAVKIHTEDNLERPLEAPSDLTFVEQEDSTDPPPR